MKEEIYAVDHTYYDKSFVIESTHYTKTGELIRCRDCNFYCTPQPRKWAKRDEKGTFLGFEYIQDPSYCLYWTDEGSGYEVEEDDFCSRAMEREEKQ